MKIKNLDLNDAIFLSYTQDSKLLWHDELLVDNNGQIIYDKEFSAILSNDNFIYIFSLENSYLVLSRININLELKLDTYKLVNISDKAEILNVYFYNSDIVVIISDDTASISQFLISFEEEKLITAMISNIGEKQDLYRVYNDIELRLISTPNIQPNLEIDGKIIQNYLCDRGNMVCSLYSTTRISLYNFENDSYLIESLDLFYPIINAILDEWNLFVILNRFGRTILVSIDLKTNMIKEYDFEGKIDFCLLQNSRLVLKHSTIEGFEFLLFEDGKFETIYRDMSEELISKEFYFEKFEGIHYKSNNPEKLLVSLHGGPESYEFNSFTNAKIYRFALNNSVDVLVANYIGSSYSVNTELSNKNWNYVIDELVRTIEYIVSKTVKDVKKVYLYSGSFGSILGLLLSARFSHNLGGHICVSPLIDLSNQIKKTSGMERKWFTDKFSTTEITEMFSDKVWKKNLPYKTFIMQSPRDKVLDFYYMKSTLNNYKCFEIDELPINGHGPETEFELDILNQSVLEKMNKLFVD